MSISHTIARQMTTIAILLVALAGCRASRQLIVPNTSEGMACWRTCQQTFFFCKQTCPANSDLFTAILCDSNCSSAQESCASTCPGAYWAGTAEQPVSRSVPHPEDDKPLPVEQRLKLLQELCDRGNLSKEQCEADRNEILKTQPTSRP